MRDPKSLAKRPTKKSDWLGQVNTPAAIANRMVKVLLKNRSPKAITILDACVGPFTFPRAMVSQHLLRPKDQITAIDIDPEMISQFETWPELQNINIRCITADYLNLEISENYDYAIINPPYIRQEWIENKADYQSLFNQQFGIHIPGTSNLYVYFVVKVIQNLKPGGRFAIIIYDSWQSTIFGRWLMEYLKYSCQTLVVDTISDQPFADRLIDATILYGKRNTSSRAKAINLKSSNVQLQKSPMSVVSGFVPLETLFSTRRGLRLKQVDFFLCELRDYERVGATPFVKKVAKLNGMFSIPEDHPEAALLIHPQEENAELLKILQNRLQHAQSEPDQNVSVLTWFKDQPTEWYIHRTAHRAPILFNYYLRKRPRHIYNPDRAFSDNFYGLIPHKGEPLAWLAVLNSTSVCAEIMAHSRNQGSGLAKIQLFEYRRILVPAIHECEESIQNKFEALGRDLVDSPHLANDTVAKIDELIAYTYSHSLLSDSNIKNIYTQLDFKARKPRKH